MLKRLALILLLGLPACVAPGSSDESESPPAETPQPVWTVWDDYLRLASQPPDPKIQMPVRGVRVRQVADTFGAPRGGGRLHEGQDIFAPKGTPVYSATEGIVTRIGEGELGGLYVFVLGPGGRRYYYAHLEAYAKDLNEGDLVTPETLIGYVGNTGNARTTPPHLHFGIYGSWWNPDEQVIDPLPLLVDRDWKKLASSAQP